MEKDSAKPNKEKKISAASSLEAKIYNQTGKESGSLSLDEKLFSLPWNADLVHQVVMAIRANNRQTTAYARGRGEVSGGGKKPWRQKGTGRARHGSIRSPLWIGGGVTHGPTKDRDYSQKINKKVRIKALFTLLSKKFTDGKILFVDTLSLIEPKTKLAANFLNELSKIAGHEKINYKKGRRALIILPAKSDQLMKSFDNIPSSSIKEAKELNPLDLALYQYVVIIEPKASLLILARRHSNLSSKNTTGKEKTLITTGAKVK